MTNLPPRGPASYLQHGPPGTEISIFDTSGVYFYPTEEDLIDFLNRKITGDDSWVVNIIPTFALGGHKPEELMKEYYDSLEKSASDLAKVQMKNISYFFRYCSWERKKSGWGQTGDRTKITNEDGDEMGTKRYLSYRESRPDGSKMTTWTIHEYSSNIDHPDTNKFCICKLIKSEGTRKKKAETKGDGSTSNNTPQLFTEGHTFQMFSSKNPSPHLHESGQNSSSHPSVTTPYLFGNQQVSYGAIPLFQPSCETWNGDDLSSLGAAVSNDKTIPDGGDDPSGFVNMPKVTLRDIEMF